jgi:TonB family protein
MQNFSRSLIAAAASAACLFASMPAARADVTYYTPPKFKHKVMPVYPDAARAAHETGTVLIKVLVAADGTPKQFILFKSSGHKDLDNAVLSAAKASTYSAAMKGTRPTIGFYDVTYKFTLTGVAQDEGNQSDLARKLNANPKDVAARLALGTNYLNQKNYAQAEQVFDAGTQLVPGNAKLWAYKGLAYFQDANSSSDIAKYKAAADAYDRALQIDPKVETNNVASAAYFNYGFRLQQASDNTGAMNYAQKAIALSPKQSQYYILLGEAQTSLGDYAGAVASLKKGETLDDKKNSIVTARIIADEANAELSQGDKVNGMADINRAEQMDPHAPFAYEYLYSYYVRTDNRAAAITPLNQLAQLMPNDPQWLVATGNIYLGQSNVVAARDAFQKAIAIKPSDPNAQFGMAEIAAASGDTASIGPIMQKVTAGADPKEAAVFESTVAILLVNASQGSKISYAADAQKYGDQATKADPNNPQGWYALGAANALLKDKNSANYALKKAYDLFKAQNNAAGVTQVTSLYKSINGSDISGYTYGRDEKTNQRPPR